MTASNLNRPNSGIGSTVSYGQDSADSGDGVLDVAKASSAGAAGKETQSGRGEEGTTTAYLPDRTETDGVLDVAQNSSTAVDNKNEGSIRQDQTGYEGS